MTQVLGTGGPGGRATTDAPSPASGDASPPRSSDLQHLLARSAARLASALGAGRVLIWERVEGRDAPAVRAACLAGGALRAPSAAEFDALAPLAAAVDLGAPGVTRELRALAERHDVCAAAVVPAGDAGPRWAIVAGGGSLRAGALRPRDLAELEAAAGRLAGPTAVDSAGARLARLDAEVQRLDRLAALGELVAEIVHEIRNPLVSVKTFLQLLPEQGGDPEFREGFGGLASEELRRVERLLDLVLDHARPGAEEAQAAEPAAAAASVAQLVGHRAAERGVGVELAVPEALPTAALPPDALRQVLLNLTLNAIDASPEGGRVRLAARSTGAELELGVEDEGPGVAPEHRARIFEPFFSTKPGRPGGLGLAISRRIAEDAGGRLELAAPRSADARGARFLLHLPLADANGDVP